MDVSEPISALQSLPNQPPSHISQSPPPGPLDHPIISPSTPLQPALVDQFHAILNFKDDDQNAADAVQQFNQEVSERKQEELCVVENVTGKNLETETVKKEEEIVKDGWSDDGYDRTDGGLEYQNRYKVDGWNDGNGLEEHDWKQEVQGTDMQVQYPLRPGAEDCSFYMRMGTCKFGFSCKFNHPPRTRNQTLKPRAKEREDSFERPLQTECKYYLSSGGCKYGKACRFSHSRERPIVAPVLEYNFLGLPIRPGEKECPYYMRNGSCKYAANCRFNHPDPTAGSNSTSGYANGEQAPSWSPSRPLNDAAPFLPISYSSSQGIYSQNLEWNQVKGPVFSPEKSFRPSTAFGSNIHPAAKSAYSDFQPQLPNEEFPVRPGQPECTFFLKTGDCKFRSACKFHHPKDRIEQTSCAMTDKGLPLRPGQSICTHYSNYGICKFGPKCRYDHPVNIQHTAPSVMMD